MYHFKNKPGKSADNAAPQGSTGSALIAKYRANVQKFLELKVGSQAVAMELTQDTFEKYLHLDCPDKIESPRAYLFRIAENLAKNHLRRERLFVVESDIAEDYKDSTHRHPSPEEWLAYTEMEEQFKIAFLALPKRCREIFYLRRFTDLSSREIAEQYGISQRMVQKHLIKAMKHFKNRLQ